MQGQSSSAAGQATSGHLGQLRPDSGSEGSPGVPGQPPANLEGSWSASWSASQAPPTSYPPPLIVALDSELLVTRQLPISTLFDRKFYLVIAFLGYPGDLNRH